MTGPQRGDRIRVVFEGVLADPNYHRDFVENVYRLTDGRMFSRHDCAIEILERADDPARDLVGTVRQDSAGHVYVKEGPEVLPWSRLSDGTKVANQGMIGMGISGVVPGSLAAAARDAA